VSTDVGEYENARHAFDDGAVAASEDSGWVIPSRGGSTPSPRPLLFNGNAGAMHK